jgi:hypothetical protein
MRRLLTSDNVAAVPLPAENAAAHRGADIRRRHVADS